MSQADGRFSTVIRVDLRQRFFADDKKGSLINELLEAHYRKGGFSEAPEPKVGRDPVAFDKLKEKLDVREAPIVYKKGGWGA